MLYGNRRTKYSDSLATYAVEGKSFNSVKVFNMLEAGFPEAPKKMFFAKNIGIVRKEFWGGQVWNLVNYQVSQ